MSERFTPFRRDDLDDAQRAVFDAIQSGPRGTVPYIFHLFLASPELGSRVQQLGAYCRYGTSLPPRLSELAILVTARHWRADYEWEIHEKEARRAGLADPVIEAIEAGRRPDFSGDEEAAMVYDFADTFFRMREVPDELFARAVELFGRKTVVELAGILGYYSMLAMAIRIFELPLEGR